MSPVCTQHVEPVAGPAARARRSLLAGGPGSLTTTETVLCRHRIPA